MKAKFFLAVSLMLLLAVPTVVQAQYDLFLWVAGIPGESTDDKHRDWIEILSFQQSVEQLSGPQAGGGMPMAQRAKHSGLEVIKKLDRASPILLDYCNSGKYIPEVIIECCQKGGKKPVFYRIRLRNVMVKSIRITGQAEGAQNLPLDEINFNYSAIEWNYVQQSLSDGKVKGSVSSGWDIRRNAPVRFP
jgi:type VI secretion system secreted protein Hcp